jgi:hypothetical protein
MAMKTIRLSLTFLALSLLLASVTLGASPTSAGSLAPAGVDTGANVIVIHAQDVPAGQVSVDAVTAAQDGWLLIRKDDKGAPGDVIGFVPVRRGTTTNVRVDIQPTDVYGEDNITPTLWATLVADPNALIPFMSPGPTITKYTSLAVVAFSSRKASSVPNYTGTYKILIHAQNVNAGQLIVDSVTAAQPSWLLIRKDDDGAPGDMIGFAPVPQGTTTGMRVDIQLTDFWGDDNITATLWATLVPDPSAATPLTAPDPIVLQAASASIVAFSSLPSGASQAASAVGVVTSSAAGANKITARAQSASSGRVVIDVVTAAQDGWLLICKNANGMPGETLGFAPVHRGLNTYVTVDVRTTNAKGDYIAAPVLWATLVADPNALNPFALPDASVQSNILAKVAFGAW